MANEQQSLQCHLEPIDLNQEIEFIELQRQRAICGWDYEQQTLQSWKEGTSLKRLFWITIPDPKEENKSIRIGHISLDPSSGILEPGLLQGDEIDLTLKTFFISPEHRALKLGKKAVQLLENLAVTKPYGDPRCRYLTLCAISKRYVYDEEWRGLWSKVGMVEPPFSIQEWYEKLDYVTWKEMPLTEATALDEICQ
ncbi:unnamed protein product [Penicillium pancosmium]